jgi:hypothetical protein
VSGQRFLRACRREAVDTTPVWFMRQAGRYMAEYRALRAKWSLLDICRNPDLATEVTLQPVRRIEVDAAILFSDLLLPLEPMGLPFDFLKGEGPQIHSPIADGADIARLKRFEPREALSHVLQAITQIQHELHGRVPLIGFRGRALHAGVLRHRGRPLEQLRQDQGADVRAPRRLASPVRAARRHRRRLSRRADRRRGERGAGVRLVGRRAQPGRLP